MGDHAHDHSEVHQQEFGGQEADHSEHSDSEEHHCIVHCSSCTHVLIKIDSNVTVSGIYIVSNQPLLFNRQLYQDPTLSLPIRPPKYNA